ncbi:MAG: cytochrome-c peroxidase [Deltaproteobacteria bacterium]|nr:cytochrome-c peroxidase [Deltaproteobacteria bacterium]
MKWSAALIATAALVGCKSKESAPAQTGSAAAPAQPEPPKVRPSQQPLPQLPALELPDDPKRTEKAELGHVLFFDKRLSGANDRACYSCHMNEDGNGGHDPIAIGSGDKKQTRHAPVIWNTAYFKGAWYWDGRAKTLEENATAAWGGGNMGAGKDNLAKKAAEILAIPGYKKLFDAAGLKGTPEDIAAALAEYERTLICKDTAYDKFAAGDKTALTEQQQRGLDIFLGKGQCLICHAPPFFSTAMGVDGGVFFNMGIGTDVPEDQVDIGRMKVTNNQTDWAAFKPPSLRNVTKSAPYFHNGSVAKLEDAVKIMSSGGIKNKNLNPVLADRGLNDGERADLLAFLAGLECPGKLDEPKLP